MKTEIEILSPFVRKVQVEIPLDMIESTFNNYVEKAQKSANLKGFRKGKVPRATVLSFYTDTITQDTFENLLNRGYQYALDQYELYPSAEPEFDFVKKFNPLEVFSFSFQVEVFPEVILRQYEGLALYEEEIQVPEDAIDKYLERMQQAYAEFNPLPEKAVEEGDLLRLTFSLTVNDKMEKNKEASIFKVSSEMDKEFPGFSDLLKATKVKEEAVLKGVFLDPHPFVKEWSLQAFELSFTLDDIVEEVLPPLNDDFIQKLYGPESNLEEFKVQLKKSFQHRFEEEANEKREEKIKEILVASNPVELPPRLIESQYEFLKQRFLNHIKSSDKDEARAEKALEAESSFLRKQAENSVHFELLVQKIAQKENLYPSEADKEAFMSYFARKNDFSKEEVKKYFKEKKDNLFYLATELKVMNFLKAKAKILPLS